MLELLIATVSGLLVGGSCVWFYYRNKFVDVLTELEDKKLIIKTIHEHADEIERHNVKKMAKEHNKNVLKKETKTKKVEKPKRKYNKKQNV